MLLSACFLSQIISPEDMVGYSEQSKGSQITKVFEDAYKSPLSIVILVSNGRWLQAAHFACMAAEQAMS
jgi:hypothetical protein